MSSESGETWGLVDHLFRRKAGEMVAALARVFGPDRIDMAEEVVQEAMMAALTSWPYRGVPDNPGGWLMTVARNRALDRVRREAILRGRAHLIERSEEAISTTFLGGEVRDDQLRMIFICCHPEIAPESRVALTLKTVDGFSVGEISRALLARPEAVAQRLVRAKRTIREKGLALEMPSTSGSLELRLDTVLEVLYLMFNEGYSAQSGPEALKEALCEEAIRLATLVVGNPGSALPKAHALLALMLFHASRFPARRAGGPEVLLLSDQDRSLWDRERIASGFDHFDRAASGDELTHFHVEAAIAAVHVQARSFEETDWAALVGLYDQLLEVRPSPIAALNRGVALAKQLGPAAGLAAVEQLSRDPRLAGYPLMPSVLGDFWLELGEHEKASQCFDRALAMPLSIPERALIEAKRARCLSSRA